MNSLKRKCIATYEVKDVKDLIRIVKLPNGQFEVNSDKLGRGAYVTRDAQLYEKVKRNKLLNRAFKTQVPVTVYEELRKEMEV